MTVADLAAEFKAAFFDAAVGLFSGEDRTVVSFGHPGINYPDDIVSVGRVTSNQDFATMSTNRTRENTLTLDVTISVERRGKKPELERVASDRAYYLLRCLEEYVRVTDPTLGGTVRHCFCTSHESDGATDQTLLARGRVIEITATFTARQRITS